MHKIAKYSFVMIKKFPCEYWKEKLSASTSSLHKLFENICQVQICDKCCAKNILIKVIIIMIIVCNVITLPIPQKVLMYIQNLSVNIYCLCIIDISQ